MRKIYSYIPLLLAAIGFGVSSTAVAQTTQRTTLFGELLESPIPVSTIAEGATEFPDGTVFRLIQAGSTDGQGALTTRRYLQANVSTGAVTATDSMGATIDDTYMWAVVGDKENGYKIYNKATGVTQILSANGASVAPIMTVESSITSTGNTTWDFRYFNWRNGNNVLESNYIGIRQHSTAELTQTENLLNWKSNPYGTIGYWNKANGGSSFWFYNYYNVKITDAGFATLYLPEAVGIPTGITAYIVSSETTTHFNLTQVTGSIIPANTGVVLEGNAGDYIFGGTGKAATFSTTGNLLTGVTEDTSLPAGNYVLQLDPTDGVTIGFYRADEAGTLAANRAYIPSTSVTSPNSFIGFNYGITSVSSATVADSESNVTYYDLQGRLVAQPKSGNIYITSKGQKVLFK